MRRSATSSKWGREGHPHRERDRETDTLLRDAGWIVVGIWEHVTAAGAADQVAELVLGRIDQDNRMARRNTTANHSG